MSTFSRQSWFAIDRKVGNEMIKAIDVLSNRLNQMAMKSIDEREHDSFMYQSTFALIGILLVTARAQASTQEVQAMNNPISLSSNTSSSSISECK
ncbi:TPA: hypothetical protein AB5F24_001799 [Vibrio cholerae]